MIKRVIIGVFFVLLIGGCFFYVEFKEAYYEKGRGMGVATVVVSDGESIFEVADELERKELISSSWVFLLGVWREKSYAEIISGKYQIERGLSPYEIVQILSKKQQVLEEVRVTFPEGWTALQMADRLNANDLPGEKFLEMVETPPHEILGKYEFLADLSEESSLEGYLFPDTFIFSPISSADFILEKMLDNFETKIMRSLGPLIAQRDKELHEILTMASIIEMEVRTQKDRHIVSDIFWKRLEDDFLLQSDATLEYVLKTNAVQHNAQDLQHDSLYNTYKYKGLPPGPVANPSKMSIEAALDPTEGPYYYFLSDPQTGETYFAENFEQHNRNKVLVGL